MLVRVPLLFGEQTSLHEVFTVFLINSYKTPLFAVDPPTSIYNRIPFSISVELKEVFSPYEIMRRTLPFLTSCLSSVSRSPHVGMFFPLFLTYYVPVSVDVVVMMEDCHEYDHFTFFRNSLIVSPKFSNSCLISSEIFGSDSYI